MARKVGEENEEDTGTAAETVDGNAGVSERSESEIEAGADGAGESTTQDDSADADEALEALAEADPKRAVVGLKKRLAKLTAQRNSARAEASERKALEARVAAYEKRERDEEEARKRAARATPEGQKAEERRRAVRETLDEAFYPGYSEQQATAALAQREAEQRANDHHAMQGISYLRSELEDHDIKVDDETLIRWERAVSSELAEDAELRAEYRAASTQKKAIQDAFERVRDGLANPILKDRGAKPLARIERNREAVLGGGRNAGAVAEAPEPKFDLTPPKGLTGRDLEIWWDQAREKAWKQLTNQESA